MVSLWKHSGSLCCSDIYIFHPHIILNGSLRCGTARYGIEWYRTVWSVIYLLNRTNNRFPVTITGEAFSTFIAIQLYSHRYALMPM